MRWDLLILGALGASTLYGAWVLRRQRLRADALFDKRVDEVQRALARYENVVYLSGETDDGHAVQLGVPHGEYRFVLLHGQARVYFEIDQAREAAVIFVGLVGASWTEIPRPDVRKVQLANGCYAVEVPRDFDL